METRETVTILVSAAIESAGNMLSMASVYSEPLIIPDDLDQQLPEIMRYQKLGGKHPQVDRRTWAVMSLFTDLETDVSTLLDFVHPRHGVEALSVAKSFIGLRAEPPRTVAGVDAPSYHALGGALASSVWVESQCAGEYDGNKMTKFLRELAKREVFWKTHTSAKSFLSETFLPRIANVLREWPKVASRLRSDEVYFDHFWLKCQIVDEAIRAKKAEEKELPAPIGNGKDPSGADGGKHGNAANPSAEIPNVPDPEQKLVRQLKGNSRALLLYMWKRGNVTLDELLNVLHIERKKKKPQATLPTKKAVRDAVTRLDQKLSEIGLTRTTVKTSDGLYCLDHPQK